MAARSLKSATISSLFWKLFEQGGNALITLVVEIVLARLLAPSMFGALAIMLVFVNVGNVIVQSGLNTAIIQAPDATERDYSTVFWMSFVISVALYIIVFLAAGFIADFYQMPAIVWPMRVLMLVLVVNSYNSIQQAIIARALEFHKTFRATVISSLVSGVIGIIMAIVGFGLWALVAQQLLMQVVRCIALAAQISWKPHFIFDKDRGIVLFRFGWKLLVSGLMDQGSMGLSDLIIGGLFTSADLGYVSQGKKYPRALGIMLDGAIQPVMLSAVAHIQDDTAKVKLLARRGLKTSTFLVTPFMALFFVTATPVVTLLLGEKWLPSVIFLQMYCIVYSFLPIHTTNLQIINGMGRSDVFLKLEIVKTVLDLVVLLFTAFVMQSLTAIVAGYIITGLGCTFINAFPNKRIIGYSYWEQIRDICPAYLLSVLAGAIAWPIAWLALPPIATILIQAAIMVVVYLGAARLFKVEASTYLWKTLREIIGRKLS